MHMKKTDVRIGACYKVKVSGKIVPVQITGENANGGWDGVNQATGKAVRIKGPARLCGKVVEAGAAKGDTPTGDVGPSAKTRAASSRRAKDGAGRDTGERGRTVAKLSALDAAAVLLSEADEPMGSKELVEQMLADGLWQTGGKTPANTLYAAMLREISKKGEASRFRKVGRGRFALADQA
jgi:hypothetical protein